MDRTVDVPVDCRAFALWAPLPGRLERDDPDEVQELELAARRMVVFRTPQDGVLRVRVTPVAPAGPVRSSGHLVVRSGWVCLTGTWSLGPHADDPGRFPWPDGEYRVDLHTPWSGDVDAPDYVLVVAASPAGGSAPCDLRVVRPGKHPRPRRVDVLAAEAADERVADAAATGDPWAQLEALEGLLRYDPRHAKGLAFRARVHAQCGNLGCALRDARQLVLAHPGYGAGWSTLARCLTAAGRLEEALLAARRAAELAASQPLPCLAWADLGDAFANLGREAEALPFWRRAAELGHQDRDELLARVELALRRRDGRGGPARRRGRGPRSPAPERSAPHAEG